MTGPYLSSKNDQKCQFSLQGQQVKREATFKYLGLTAMVCALMPINYFVVVVLPSRQIKPVVRLAACNYERCVFVTIFSR